jgi:hypothetical protein
MRIKEVKPVDAKIPTEKRDPETGKMKKTYFKLEGVSLELDDLHAAFKEDQIVMENGHETKAHGTKIFYSSKWLTFGVRSASCPVRNKLDDEWQVTHTRKQANIVLTTSTKNGGSKGGGLKLHAFKREYPQLAHLVPIIMDTWDAHEAEQAAAELEKQAA